MGAFSLKNILKYLKIVVVHPITEIVLDILYLVSIINIGVIIFKESEIYDDHEILDMTETYLNYNAFNNIKTANQFNLYLESTLERLFSLNPQAEGIPLFIPLNPIRFIPFQNKNDCNQIDYMKTCRNEPNKFKCAIENLSKSFKFECGKSFSDKSKIFQKKLTGYYASYNIRSANNFIDITKNTYYSIHQHKINEIIQDKQLKAIFMQINLAAPSNHNYIDIILGIEMTNYFTDVKNIFTVYIFNDSRPKTNFVLFFFFVVLGISVILNIIKLLYEINIKCIWSIHSFYFASQVFDTILMTTCIIYIIEDKDLDFKVDLEHFESHLAYINIIWYLKVFFAILVICFPFRFLGLLSWWKSISEPFILSLNVIFRMVPGIFVTATVFLCMFLMFVFTNYFLYNDMFYYYQSIFYSFLSSFNIRILMTIYDKKNNSRIFGNLFQSQYSVCFVFFQIVFVYFYSSLIIATFVYLYKKAILLQDPPKDNKYVTKLKEIEKKLEEKKAAENINFDTLKKQILWLNLDDKKTIGSEFISKHQVLFFKNSNQILSFLKCIFAIKPEMQFKKLIYKLNIVIEINKKKFGENELKQINHLADWFIFVGCKIPIIIYGKSNFDHSLKMKLHNIYKLTCFINDENILDKILENKGKKVLSISNNNNLTFSSQTI